MKARRWLLKRRTFTRSSVGMFPITGKMTERFTRTEDGVILYQFEIDDPEQYSQVWKGEMPMRTATGAVYEYACHEGNYGLLGILEGARQQERRGGKLELTADDEG
jgi:hypothetical protein